MEAISGYLRGGLISKTARQGYSPFYEAAKKIPKKECSTPCSFELDERTGKLPNTVTISQYPNDIGVRAKIAPFSACGYKKQSMLFPNTTEYAAFNIFLDKICKFCIQEGADMKISI